MNDRAARGPLVSRERGREVWTHSRIQEKQFTLVHISDFIGGEDGTRERKGEVRFVP